MQFISQLLTFCSVWGRWGRERSLPLLGAASDIKQQQFVLSSPGQFSPFLAFLSHCSHPAGFQTSSVPSSPWRTECVAMPTEIAWHVKRKGKLLLNFLSLQGHHSPSNHRQFKLNNKIGITSQRSASITHLRLVGIGTASLKPSFLRLHGT